MSDAPPPERPSHAPTPGTRVAFDMTSERGRIVLTLEDGAELHVHPIVVDVVKTQATDEKGDPVYQLIGGLAVRLMKPPSTKG